MAGHSKGNSQLLEELEGLRRRLAELEPLPEGRKPGPEELVQGELGYRQVYEKTPAMFFTVDTKGKVLLVNPYGAEKLGYEVKELLGQPVFAVFHQDDRETVRRQLKMCVESPDQTFDWELRKVRKDGTLMWVREVARGVITQSAKVVVLIACEDISVRKGVEQLFKESHEKYRTLYSKAPVMLHSIDAQHRFLDVSDYWLQVLGYDRSEVIGRLATDFMTEESRRWVLEEKLPEFFREGQVWEVPIQFVKKNGEVIDILLSAIAERNVEGEFVRDLAVLVDVTQQRRAEEILRRDRDELERRVQERTAELERQRKFLRQVIDVDPNFIFAKDREGRYTLVNEAVAEVYGTTVEDLIGKRDADFNPNPEEVESFRRIDREVMDSMEERFIPLEAVTDSKGKQRWVQTVKRPLVDEKGRATQVLGCASDITARKEAEEQLRKSEEFLRASQTELRALAGRLINAQEDERRYLAREMHDDLTQRVAALALQVGRIEQMAESPSAKLSEVVDKIRTGLVALSSDMHVLSRRLHPSILDDLGLVDAMAAECAGFSDRDKIPILFDSRRVPSKIPKEVALCLYRITQEALWNVVKHARAKEVRVNLVGKNGELILTVVDKGVGFDPEVAAHGPGMGLASIKERARLIQAELTIESKPGQGTKIMIRAPLGTDPHSQDQNPRTPTG